MATQIITNKSDFLFHQLEDYIASHLEEDLSISALCSKFYISRSKLYSISKEKWAMGITDYIRNARMEAANKMLLTTALSVNEIAEKTGFQDTNYFIRLFKKQTILLLINIENRLTRKRKFLMN